MNFETMINDSINFTRDTLLGNPIRWLIFILLSLPGGLLPIVLNIRDMTSSRTVFHWELVHWDQVAALVILMLLASFFLSGYIVRIYRGGATPPAFDKWAGLFFDGLKLCIVWLILLLVAMILMLIAVILGTIGAIRFARTGSIMEGVNYHEILATITVIGWWDYIVAGIIIIVTAIIFGIVTGILGLIPFIGWVLELVIGPIVSVLVARFISLVYDVGVPPAPVG